MLLLGFSIGSPLPAFANIKEPNLISKAIEAEQIQIMSDSAEIDATKGIAIHQGNVTLIEGGKKLNADKLVIHRNENGKLEKIVAIGKPATFTGQNMESSQLMQGHANNISLYPQKNEVILEGDALFVQNGDQFNAPYISYNFQTKIVKSHASDGARPTLRIKAR